MGGQVDSTTANVTENQLKLCLILFNAIFKTVLYIKFMNFEEDTAIGLLQHSNKFCSKKKYKSV